MSLVEIARFTDVYEADLAAAFLASHDIEVSVTERFQTTVDPLMQRALGIRLMGHAENADQARELLERARQGEFMEADGDDVVTQPQARWAGRGLALFAAMASGYPGTSLPRQLKPIQIAGMLLIVAMVALSWVLWLWAM